MTTHILAAARDGSMLLTSFHFKGSEEDALNHALTLASSHFDLSCPQDEIEGELDGFALNPLNWLVD